MSGEDEGVLHVQFLCEDDALEMIQPIERFPPRLSKHPAKFDCDHRLLPPENQNHQPADGLRCLRRKSRRRSTLSSPLSTAKLAAGRDDNEDDDAVDAEENENAQVSMIRRELLGAQLEADVDECGVGGRAVFSFQRSAQARCKQLKKGEKQRAKRNLCGVDETEFTAEKQPIKTGRKRLVSVLDENTENTSAVTESSPECRTPKRQCRRNTPSLRSGSKSKHQFSLRATSKLFDSPDINSQKAMPKYLPSPARLNEVSSRTPPTKKKPLHRSPLRTPQRLKNALGIERGDSPSTPYALRRRIKLRLSKMSQDDLAVSDNDDSDVSDFVPSENEESDSDDEDDEQLQSHNSPNVECETRSLNGASATAHSTGVIDPLSTIEDTPLDDYFLQQSTTGVTSDRTLSRLQQPRLSEATLRRLTCSGADDEEARRHGDGRRALLRHCDILFDRWLLLLTAGYNVALYGLGSKRIVLERFRVRRLSDQLHVVVNGFFPDLSVRQLLRCLLFDAIGLSPSQPLGNTQSQIDFVFRYFNDCPDEQSTSLPPRLFLLVASMDGPAMRTSGASGGGLQNLLCKLAAAERVHIIGSVDHINAPLLWDQNRLSVLNLIWFDATTMAGYVEETSYENSLLVQGGGKLALSSLRYVYRSLTQNARGVFSILAKEQVKHREDRNCMGMSESALYRRCRDSFLVSSQLALTAQLTEFRDHKLLTSRTAADGTQMLSVPLDTHLIADFLDTCDSL